MGYVELGAGVTDAGDPGVGVAIGGDTVNANTPGVYMVTYDATDASGNAALQVTRTVTVQDTIPPTPGISGPSSGLEGSPVALVGSAADLAGANATIAFAWSVTKDGAPYASGTGVNIDFTPNDNGAYVATLPATDAAGNSASIAHTVAVANAAPAVEAGADVTVDEGVEVVFAGSFSDPGADTHTVGWAFGDGESASGSLAPAHVFQNAGVYTVTLTVTDDDGGVGVDSLSVTVDEVPSYTQPGENVEVTPIDETTGEPSPVSVNFGEVTQGGETTVSTSTPSETQSPPVGLKVGSPGVIFNIETDAVFEGNITIGIYYGDIEFKKPPTKIFHFEEGIGWVDVTSGHDVENQIIYATVTSLSPFAIFEEGTAPEVTITGPASGFVVPVNSSIDLAGLITDPDPGDTFDAQWTISKSNSGADLQIIGTVVGGVVGGQVVLAEPGIYMISLEVEDSYNLSDTDDTVNDQPDTLAFVVVYDPVGGFVTGGGWIYSPPGAYTPDPLAEGKATFGFVSKYKKGATVPEGNTEFHFRSGGLKFLSSSYDWLVVAGSKAMFKGTGAVDGTGSYKFMLTARDGEPDMFRIRIWQEDAGGNEEVIYDNQMADAFDADADTALGGGSVIIHSGK